MIAGLPTLNIEATAWICTWLLLVIGVLSTFLPFLPGPLIVYLAAIVHRIWVPESEISTTCLVITGVLLVIAYLIDFFASAAGARWFGSSRWGVGGVILGGLVGLFFGLPGVLIGPIVGGFAFEMLFAKKGVGSATKSTWGTIVGTVTGLALKIGIAVAMALGILYDLYVSTGP